MPLTPDDVDNKRFSTAGVMRQGYDMTEVDNFLDEVAAEMKRLHTELNELSSNADGGPADTQGSAAAPASGSSSEVTAAVDDEASDENGVEAKADGTTSAGASEGVEAEANASEGGTTEGDEPTETTATDREAAETSDVATHSTPAEEGLAEGETEVARVSGNRGELLRVATTEDAAAAAARMLELAGRNAEELVADARSEADRIVSEASGRAEELDGETEQRREKLVADLERDHQELSSEVEDLRAFEREYRAQLRNYFQQQLEALDAQGGGVTLAEDLHEDEGEIGSRLRSILAEEEDEPEQAQQVDGAQPEADPAPQDTPSPPRRPSRPSRRSRRSPCRSRGPGPDATAAGGVAEVSSAVDAVHWLARIHRTALGSTAGTSLAGSSYVQGLRGSPCRPGP